MKTIQSLDPDITKVLSEIHKNAKQWNFSHYEIQEDVLQLLGNKHRDNRDFDKVNTKVKLLNLFYSTNLLATNQMSQHIIDLDIDISLIHGDTSIVEKIARLNGRENYSFATKYCALHQPDKFPIFDSIVADVFVSLLKKGFFQSKYKYSSRPKEENEYNVSTFYKEVLRKYPKYVEFYKFFMNTFGIMRHDFRKVDFYIWGAVKIPQIQSELEKILSSKDSVK